MNDIIYYTIQDVWWKWWIALILCMILGYVIYCLIRGDILLFSYFDSVAALVLGIVLYVAFIKVSSALSPQGLVWFERIKTVRSSTIPCVEALVDSEGSHEFTSYDAYRAWFYADD